MVNTVDYNFFNRDGDVFSGEIMEVNEIEFNVVMHQSNYVVRQVKQLINKIDGSILILNDVKLELGGITQELLLRKQNLLACVDTKDVDEEKST